MNEIENYFDQQASSWDKNEKHTEEEKIALLNKLNLNVGDIVLDIACGTGVISGLIHNITKSDVLGIDISQNMINIAQEKYKNEKWAYFKKEDFLSFNENRFDYAIIYNAYPHFLDVEALANKLSSVLKKGGHFTIIHSLSRAQLDKIHSQKASHVSRTLSSPKEESKYFNKLFKIENAYEDDHSYLIIGKKR